MKRLIHVAAATAATLALAAMFPSGAAAQWVRLQRCGSALPCAIPFGVRYKPDLLIASQYGYVSPNGISGRVSFWPELSVQLDEPHVSLELGDFSEQAARKFVLAHPPPAAPPSPPPPPK
jgi:hypothetical protein